MFLIEFLPPRPHALWALARQMGITHCVVKVAPELTGLGEPWKPGVLETIQRELAEAGLTLIGLEGDPFDLRRVKLGLPGREEDLAHYRDLLREMGRLGLRLLCYNFMAGLGWHRSGTSLVGRGGALVSGFHYDADAAALSPEGEISTEKIWGHYTVFIEAILPVAREQGIRLGAHPDDPPVPMLRGIGRILQTPAQFDRVLSLSEDRTHGLTFCQANWKLICDGDRAALAREAKKHAKAGRIHFLHLRHVRGTRTDFVETFHDEGAAEFIDLLPLYHASGFRGPVRCDHVPTLAGEESGSHVPGYGTLGRLYADGYLLGLMDALGLRTDPLAWLNSTP